MGAPSDATLVTRRFRILVPLRHRDFRFLWSGMTVSLLGDGITTIALAWQAYELSNAPTALSVVGVAWTLPNVLLLLPLLVRGDHLIQDPSPGPGADPRALASPHSLTLDVVFEIVGAEPTQHVVDLVHEEVIRQAQVGTQRLQLPRPSFVLD